MPRPNHARADAFTQKTSPAAPQGGVPYISAQAMGGAIYEKNALPSTAFEDPVEKENNALKDQLAALQEQLANRASGLMLQENGGIVVEGFQFSPTGLIAPEKFTSESWEHVGLLLFRLEGSLQWLIGDWLNYGGAEWGDATKFAQTFGRDPGTLHNYAFVSREIQFSFRNENLSYTHHVVAASAKLTPEQLRFSLEYAAEHKLSVVRFRQWIKEQQGEVPTPALPDNTESVLSPEETHQRRRDLGDFISDYNQVMFDPDGVKRLTLSERNKKIDRIQRTAAELIKRLREG